VTVNSVLPGPTRSAGVVDFIDGLARQQHKSAEQVEQDFFRQTRPSSLLQRFATPEEVASLVAYVCSPLASATDAANLYLQGQDARSPLASPVFADLSGLPPLLILVGDAEVLLADSHTLAARASAAVAHVWTSCRCSVSLAGAAPLSRWPSPSISSSSGSAAPSRRRSSSATPERPPPSRPRVFLCNPWRTSSVRGTALCAGSSPPSRPSWPSSGGKLAPAADRRRPPRQPPEPRRQ